MKGRPLLVTALVSLIAGLVFTVCHKSIKAEGLTVAAGIMFVVVGSINLFFTTRDPESKGFSKFLTMTANIAALALGASLLIFRGTFATLITVVFGIALAACALWQLSVIMLSSRRLSLPSWLYAFPALLAIAAIFIFTRDTGAKGSDDTAVMITTGISLLVLSVASVIEHFIIAARLKAMQAPGSPSQVTDVQAVDITPRR